MIVRAYPTNGNQVQLQVKLTKAETRRILAKTPNGIIKNYRAFDKFIKQIVDQLSTTL